MAKSEKLSVGIRKLQAQVKRLQRERDRLRDNLEVAERRIVGLQEDLMRIRKMVVG